MGREALTLVSDDCVFLHTVLAAELILECAFGAALCTTAPRVLFLLGTCSRHLDIAGGSGTTVHDRKPVGDLGVEGANDGPTPRRSLARAIATRLVHGQPAAQCIQPTAYVPPRGAPTAPLPLPLGAWCRGVA